MDGVVKEKFYIIFQRILDNMSRLSKFKGLENYTAKDLLDEKKRKEIAKINPTFFKDLRKTTNFIIKHHIKKEVQPFKTNYLLETLLNLQTPKWVNYTILIISSLVLIIGILALLHSYRII